MCVCLYECVCVWIHSDINTTKSYQCVEGGDGEDPQAPHGEFCGAWGESQQALGIGQLAPLQAGKVTAEPEQIHMEPLQVLFPQEDLNKTEKKDKQTEDKNYKIRCM